jgi:hypothetical protein
MWDCQIGGPGTEFVRWLNPTLGSVLFDRDLAGFPYTPTGVLTTSPCYTTFVEPACLKTVLSTTVIPGTFDARFLDISTQSSLHWIVNGLTGLAYPGGAPVPGPNPNPIDMNDIAAVNAVLTAALGPGVVAYTIDPTNNLAAYIFALTPTAVTDHPGLFWWGTATDYNAKDGLSDGLIAIPGAGTVTYRSVEVVKTVSDLAGNRIVQVALFEKDGAPIAPTPSPADWELGHCGTPLVFDVCLYDQAAPASATNPQSARQVVPVAGSQPAYALATYQTAGGAPVTPTPAQLAAITSGQCGKPCSTCK